MVAGGDVAASSSGRLSLAAVEAPCHVAAVATSQSKPSMPPCKCCTMALHETGRCTSELASHPFASSPHSCTRTTSWHDWDANPASPIEAGPHKAAIGKCTKAGLLLYFQPRAVLQRHAGTQDGICCKWGICRASSTC